jgi:tetratricopeptide (TPR) repeat protein
MAPFVQRAWALMEQRRYDLAAKEVRQALSATPDDGYLHAVLAECLRLGGDPPAALAEAWRGVQFAPNLAYAHYVLGCAYGASRRLPEAHDALLEAVGLDPTAADYWTELAAVRVDRGQWSLALQATEQALAANPCQVRCHTVRAWALLRLGKRGRAEEAVRRALELAPDYAFAHSVQGWIALDDGDVARALGCFREALRLDPLLKHARLGLVEALRRSNTLDGLLQSCWLAAGRSAEAGRVAGLVMTLIFLGPCAALIFDHNHPEWQPWLRLSLIALSVPAIGIFVAPSWLDLLMRWRHHAANPLSPEEAATARRLGGVTLAALVCLGWWTVTQLELALAAAALCAFMLVPIFLLTRCSPGWPRWVFLAYVAALGGLGVLVLNLELARAPRRAHALTAYVVGCYAALFVLFALTACKRRLQERRARKSLARPGVRC